MAILPVSSVEFNSRSSVSFARKNDSEGAPADRGMTAPLGKTVPVIVLMAMNPSLLNTAATANNYTSDDMNENSITMVVPANTPDIDEATYVIEPETVGKTQSVNKPPYGWYCLNARPINEIHHGHNSLGDFDMVFAHDPGLCGKDGVSKVYILSREREIPAPGQFHPPEVFKLMYHNIGKDKEFCGVITKEDLLDEKGNYQGSLETEIKLDDESAQKLIDLITGHSNWKNNTGIRIYETKSAMLKPGKRY